MGPSCGTTRGVTLRSAAGLLMPRVGSMTTMGP